MPIPRSMIFSPRMLRTAGVCAFALCMGAAHAQGAQELIAKGDSLLGEGKPQRALDYFEKAIIADASAPSYLGRARAWYLLDRMDRFLTDVEKALRLDSSSAEAHYQRGLYALRAEDPYKAEYHAGKAINHSEDAKLRAHAHILRGDALAELNHNDRAIVEFESGLAKGVDDPLAMRTLARLYDGTGRHADALALLEKLCVLEPQDVGHWTNRGFELIMLERYAEALPMVEHALEIDKDEPVALSNRAYVFMKMDRDKEAWSDVERSLKSFPANAHALRTRALLRLRKGEREKACEDLGVAKALGDVPEVDQLLKEHCGGPPMAR